MAVPGRFLPLHHIAAVRGAAPRNAHLIAGASGTTDIEDSYVRGAHGPRCLHVVLVAD